MNTQAPYPERETPFRIKQHDCQTRWLVQSESDGEIWYLVDLMAYHQIGRCDCADFAMRKEPIARMAKHAADFLRCKHIRCVRDSMLNMLLREIGKNYTKEIE